MRHLRSLATILACSAIALGGNGAPASAQSYYTTGTYTIDAAHSVFGDAYVGADSSGNLTDSMGNPYNPTVNLVTGGSISHRLYTVNSSVVNISGGTIGDAVESADSSLINISGGTIEGSLGAGDSSKVNISGGSIAGSAGVQGSGQVTISGGSIGSVTAINGNGQVIITGGSIGSEVAASSNTQITISGGTFDQVNGLNFYDETTGSFTFIGKNLVATNAGSVSGGTDYNLSGTLLDGTNLNGDVLFVGTGINFTLQEATATPEPGSVALLVGPLFALGGIAARKRVSQRKRRI